MSLNTITEPAATVGAYDYKSMLYQFEDVYPYTAITDDGGNLQLTIGAPAVADLSVGEFLWVEPLVGVDLIDSAVVEILSLGGDTVTVDTDYNAAYSSTGDIRAMKSLAFVIQTGFGVADQPLRQAQLSLRPDPNGIYNINPYQSVISRFTYSAPETGDSADYYHSVRYRVFALSVGTATYKNAFKSIGTTLPSVIRYNDLQNLVNYYDGTILKTDLETPATQVRDSSGDQNQEINVYAFDCTTYEFTFSDPFDESFVTYTTESWVSVDVSGVAVQGVVFDFAGESAGEFSWTIEYDDGANLKTYTFTIFLQNTIACRTSCNGRRFFWWSREGGWCSYDFSLAITNEISGGQSQLKQVDNVVSAVRYQRQQQLITMIANIEGETIFDYLKGMLYALNVYEAIDFSDTAEDFDLYYFDSASGAPKNTQPFLATSNQFGVSLIKGAIEERINEGR